MSAISFEYDAKDNASATIDRVTNKMQGLRREYGEMRRSISQLKQGLSVMSGMGIGAATGVLGGLGMGKEEKAAKVDANGKKIVEMFKEQKSSIVDTFSQGARMGSLMLGGALGGMMFDKMSSGGFGGGFAGGGGSTFAGGGGSRIESLARNSFADFANNMNLFEGGNTKSFNQMMRGQNIRNTTMPGRGGSSTLSRASNLGGAGALLRAGGMIARLGAGFATAGVAIAAQLAYEYGVQPIIDEGQKYLGTKEYSKEYLDSLSQNYLSKSERSIRKDIWNQTTEGMNGQWWLIGEVFGTNKARRDELTMQISGERSKRYNEVTKALWLQNRE